MGLLTAVTLVGSIAVSAAPDGPPAGSGDTPVDRDGARLPEPAPHPPRSLDAVGPTTAAGSEALRSPEPRVVRRQPPVSGTPLLGRVAGLRLHQPAVAPIAVGFHEAATERALPMRPLGRLLDGDATTRTHTLGDTAAGWPYVVLPSRGRNALPTTAVDVALRDGEPVLAPVSGEVIDVRSYLLEGRHPDRRIEIRPDAAPARRVVVIHVEGVQVAAGDRVDAGITPIARTARRFPFASQIDARTAPDHWPHVHIEVQRQPPSQAPITVPPGEGERIASG